MDTTDTPKCLGCNKPALPGEDAVPLCADCKALAVTNARGVTYGHLEGTRTHGN